jgi:FtsP/CotA-like multicopper oxidase with cupredoxin domain
MAFWRSFLWSLTVSPLSLCAVLLESQVRNVERGSACVNGPATRACWTNGYSIATDSDQKFPTTGKTVSYTLEVTNTTCNPDGSGSRICMLVNGQYPGPTLRASWGDTLDITVKNSLQNNGTSIHYVRDDISHQHWGL